MGNLCLVDDEAVILLAGGDTKQTAAYSHLGRRKRGVGREGREY